jgi:hypothetical protein
MEHNFSSQIVYRYKNTLMEDTQIEQASFPLSDSEEQRKIAEGADALLNLAGISTRKRAQSTVLYPPGKIKENCIIISVGLLENLGVLFI